MADTPSDVKTTRSSSRKAARSLVSEHPITVLLIDDQPIIAEAVRRMLEDAPEIRLQYCDSASQAIPAALEVQPTVILQDLVMPQSDGLMLVRFFRAHPATRRIPIIVLSTKEEPEIKAKAFANGANDYLVKLPDKVELQARIRYHSLGYIHLLERDEAFEALEESLQKLRDEQEKSERLLLNVLPRPIADRLKAGEVTIAESYSNATVLFGDICGFTEMSSHVGPHELVTMLDRLFSAFDRQVEARGVEKIKTIGDAYMAVSGLPTPCDDHAQAMAEVALDMLREVREYNLAAGSKLEMRIGIHSGPVVAGVIGKHKFAYDLWGDTVNFASRMESHGAPGRIHVSAAVKDLLDDRYVFEPRGEIAVKGKGTVSTYFLVGRK
jgi:class 3 adenylate cyclase